mmetsp:Transcript_1681/g.5895  ORF Transcript_1681/g.5895 Transcript_1681/m.5895 type:complete len:965 (+) Transcript_1681:133-3027(+)
MAESSAWSATNIASKLFGGVVNNQGNADEPSDTDSFDAEEEYLDEEDYEDTEGETDGVSGSEDDVFESPSAPRSPVEDRAGSIGTLSDGVSDEDPANGSPEPKPEPLPEPILKHSLPEPPAVEQEPIPAAEAAVEAPTSDMTAPAEEPAAEEPAAEEPAAEEPSREEIAPEEPKMEEAEQKPAIEDSTAADSKEETPTEAPAPVAEESAVAAQETLTEAPAEPTAAAAAAPAPSSGPPSAAGAGATSAAAGAGAAVAASGAAAAEANAGGRVMNIMGPDGRPMQVMIRAPPGAARSANGAAAPTPAANVTLTPEQRTTREKLQAIRVKLLRLSRRLGYPNYRSNAVVSQVIYRLQLAEQLRAGREAMRAQGFSVEDAQNIAAQEESEGKPLELGLTILLLGKSGTGKSQTINSLFNCSADSPLAPASAYSAETRDVQVLTGETHGIPITVIDTPGLLPSLSDHPINDRMLKKVKSITRSRPPDIVLYFDRLDVPSSSPAADLPLLKAVTRFFGNAVWFNAIVVLTHGATAPPEQPNGQLAAYDYYVAKRSSDVQQVIRAAAGDSRLMNPVSLVENHPNCRTNRNGEPVLPNGQAWKPHLLLLCFASKILTEANSLLHLQEGNKGQGGMPRMQKVPPLPYMLSALITSRPPRKPMEQYMGEEEVDPQAEFIDEPPPPHQQVEIPAPEIPLPAAFHEESGVISSHHFRFLESANRWQVRPVVESHGYDHQSGIDGFSVEKGLNLEEAINPRLPRQKRLRSKTPAVISGQIMKDKKEMNIQAEAETSVAHKQGLTTTAGLDVQTVGRDLAYTARTETRWKHHPTHKTIAGGSIALIGGARAQGLKMEHRWKVKPGTKMVLAGGVMKAKKDMALGANAELVASSKDPNDTSRFTVGGSLMKWKKDLALGMNASGQFQVKDMQLAARANLNSRGQGNVTVRASSNERLQLSLLGIIPLVSALFSRARGE